MTKTIDKTEDKALTRRKFLKAGGAVAGAAAASVALAACGKE